MTSRADHEATCLVIAALAGESQHGCGILARVRDMRGGGIHLRVGTLFSVLYELHAAGLVKIDRDEVVGGRPRRYYQLSSPGCGRPVQPARLAARPDLRVSDADRDIAAGALGEHFVQGRLTADELYARLGLALAAVTRRDISQATQDLP